MGREVGADGQQQAVRGGDRFIRVTISGGAAEWLVAVTGGRQVAAAASMEMR